MPEKTISKVVTFTSNIWKVATIGAASITFIASGVLAWEQIELNRLKNIEQDKHIKEQFDLLDDRLNKKYLRLSEEMEELKVENQKLESELEEHLIQDAYHRGSTE